jgi:hypothetical protein
LRLRGLLPGRAALRAEAPIRLRFRRPTESGLAKTGFRRNPQTRLPLVEHRRQHLVPARDLLNISGTPTPLAHAEGNIGSVAIARRRRVLRGRRPRARTEPICARTGRSAGRSERKSYGPRREGNEPQADDAWTAEVRRARSTDEVVEQCRNSGGGGDGGKEPGQGEHEPAKRAPDSEPGSRRAQCAGSCAPSRKKGQGKAVHCASASRHRGTSPSRLFRTEQEGGAWD